MKKVEITLIFLALLGLILNLMLIPGGAAIMTITLTSLSFLYVVFSFALLNKIRLRNIFKKESYNGINALNIINRILIGFALSFLVVAIPFKILNWPGSGAMAFSGLCTLAFCLLLLLIEYWAKKTTINKGTFIRMVAWGSVVLFLMMLPKYAITAFKFRAYPAYINALKNAEGDPNNEQLQQKLEDERKKMEMDMDMKSNYRN